LFSKNGPFNLCALFTRQKLQTKALGRSINSINLISTLSLCLVYYLGVCVLGEIASNKTL
jgi:hypothetical protein